MKTDGGDFVTGGHLGYMNFPPVDGGKGDPSNTVGNPGQYLSISSKATAEEKEIAKKFFATGVLDDAEVKAWVDTGGVPIVKGSRQPARRLEGRRLAQVRLRRREQRQDLRPVLGPGAAARRAAETLLDNIAKLFQLSITPAAVRHEHERGHRQVTVASVGTARPRAVPTATGAHGRSLAWLAVPALVFFVAFGVIPLLGVLALSFTTWDGIGEIHAVRPRPAGRPCSPIPACRTRCG